MTTLRTDSFSVLWRTQLLRGYLPTTASAGRLSSPRHTGKVRTSVRSPETLESLSVQSPGLASLG